MYIIVIKLEISMLEKHKRINITLPESMDLQLSTLAKEINSKKSHIIAEALSLYIEELDYKIAEKRYDNYKSNHEKTYSLEETEKIIG
jgi:predicted DNA-binding protein